MTGLQHPLVLDYLARVESAARGLPPSIRAELVADLSAHLDSSLSSSPSEAAVDAALKDLGDPRDVVAAAYEGLDAEPRTAPVVPGPLGPQPSVAASPWGPVEVIAIVGLTLGAFLLPLLGPVVGLVMSWVSQRWTRRDKIVGTLLYLAPLLLVPFVAAAALFSPAHLLVVGLIGFVGPLAAGAYLAVRLTSRRDR